MVISWKDEITISETSEQRPFETLLTIFWYFVTITNVLPIRYNLTMQRRGTETKLFIDQSAIIMAKH